MRVRCTATTNKDWPNYGGRGITVCERWSSFENFIADMGERPSAKHSIGRIDNDGPYSPDNCRWELMHDQNRNKRSTVLLTHNGETLCIRDWSAKIGIPESTLYNRHRRGWPTIDMLTLPVFVAGDGR
jgi:hypothetical protein